MVVLVKALPTRPAGIGLYDERPNCVVSQEIYMRLYIEWDEGRCYCIELRHRLKFLCMYCIARWHNFCRTWLAIVRHDKRRRRIDGNIMLQ